MQIFVMTPLGKKITIDVSNFQLLASDVLIIRAEKLFSFLTWDTNWKQD